MKPVDVQSETTITVSVKLDNNHICLTPVRHRSHAEVEGASRPDSKKLYFSLRGELQKKNVSSEDELQPVLQAAQESE